MAAPSGDPFAFCLEAPPGQARRALELRLTGSAKGKGLFATRNIRKGDMIFVEKPVVSAQFLWNALYKYRACDHCLRALETAEENAQRLLGRFQILPHPEKCSIQKDLHQCCPSCQVAYCSLECRQAAWTQYHQILCLGPSKQDPGHPLNKLQEAWRNIHYPPETSSIMLMARMVATVKQAKDKEWWIKLFSQFCNKTANEEEEIIHKLLGDKFKGQLEVLRMLFTEALYDDHLSKWFSPEGFRSLFALVGTNGQGIGTSSLSQWVRACDALELPAQEREQLDTFIDQLYKDIEKETGDFLNCEGSGLYMLQSCCNHSCLPNAEASFPDNNFVLHLTAVEDIHQGEFCKHKEPNTLKDLYNQDDNHQELGNFHVRSSYVSEKWIEGRVASLQNAVDEYYKAKNEFAAKATEDQIKLLRQQRRFQDEFDKPYVDLSLHDTVYNLILDGKHKFAEHLYRDFRIPDKRFWWLKISALAEQGAWEDLEKFSKSKKSPIGYLPFAEISMKYGSPGEAKKYAARVTPEQKVKAFLLVGDFSQAAEAAVERKNEAEMALILSKCTDASVVAKLEQAKAQLGKK